MRGIFTSLVVNAFFVFLWGGSWKIKTTDDRRHTRRLESHRTSWHRCGFCTALCCHPGQSEGSLYLESLSQAKQRLWLQCREEFLDEPVWSRVSDRFKEKVQEEYTGTPDLGARPSQRRESQFSIWTWNLWYKHGKGKDTQGKNRTFPILKGELLFSLVINIVLIALKLYLKIDIKDSNPKILSQSGSLL